MLWIFSVVSLVLLGVSANVDKHHGNDSSSLLSLYKTREGRSFPDVFIIGAQKCATSSLYEVLMTHREVCSKGDKEKHYFDNDLAYSNTSALEGGGLQAYHNQFAGCKGKVTIDASPRYIQVPSTPGRIVASYPPSDLLAKKFILLLREPTTRLFSEYQDFVRKCIEQGSFKAGTNIYTTAHNDNEFRRSRSSAHCNETMRGGGFTVGMTFNLSQFYSFAEWSRTPAGLQETTRGHYASHLRHWLEAGVRRQQLLVVSFHLLLANTSDTVSRITSFLELKHDNHLTKLQTLPQAHEQQHWPDVTILDCPTAKALHRHYQQETQDLYRLLASTRASRPMAEQDFPSFPDASAQVCT